MNFWNEIKEPFFALAPMEDVTDTTFREVVMSVSDGKWLNVLFTEFTSTDGLLHDKGFEKVAQRLHVNKSEIKILKSRNTQLVAQIWGNNPKKFYKATKLITDMKLFNGIDINMGCPVKNVVKKGTCSALIQFPELATEIIRATQEATSLPVSVKTRIGFKTIDTENWISNLLKTHPAALTIHGRIQKQMSEGLANWDEIGKAAQLRNELSPNTKIIGNGDIESIEQANSKITSYGLDGIMVGRGVFKNPWMYNKISPDLSTNTRIDLLLKHTCLFEKTWGENKNFNELKRFYKIYINSFKGAGNLRAMLMECKNYKDVYTIIEKFKASDYANYDYPKEKVEIA